MTYILCEHLGDVLAERLLDDMQCSMTWDQDWGFGDNPGVPWITASNGETVANVAGHAQSNWTAGELAKVGYLYLNKGMWNNRRILPEWYIEETFTDIPFEMNPWFAPPLSQSEERLSVQEYGLGWWRLKLSSDITVWYMGGHGQQFCVVLPEYNIVMTKVNDWDGQEDNHGLAEFINILRACLEPHASSPGY
jgi:CubicO group peptidase (beta-lactamase class C family)